MRGQIMLGHDIRFQLRHGIYGVYVLVCGLYIWLLHHIPLGGYREMTALLLTFSDPSAVGLIIAGGIVLLERDQGVLAPLFVTPIRLYEYLFGKVFSLCLVSLVAAWAIHMFSLGLPLAPFRFSLGVVLTSSFFTLLSMGIVVRCRSMNSFLLWSQVYAFPFTLPILGLFGIGDMTLYGWLPTSGSFILLKTAFEHVSGKETLYAMAVLVIGNAGVYAWASRSFRQAVLRKIGKGREAL